MAKPKQQRFRVTFACDLTARDAESAQIIATSIAFQTELSWPMIILDPPSREERSDKVWVVDVVPVP